MTGVQTCALPICFPVTIGGAEIKEIKENIRELFGKVNEQGGDKKAMEVELKNISKRFDSLLTFMYVIGGAVVTQVVVSVAQALK